MALFTKSPFKELTSHLVKTNTKVSVQRTHTPAVSAT
ncbi:rCG62197 [Rattus norvegicus]|uniref:RCG62197 n=1 Tax=Rattus norvegicus TaxID=10116 RepID=A6HBC2_RAT|nr:rCG62197 [Rattus norvegicus]